MAEGNKCGENEKVFFSTSGSEEEVIEQISLLNSILLLWAIDTLQKD